MSERGCDPQPGPMSTAPAAAEDASTATARSAAPGADERAHSTGSKGKKGCLFFLSYKLQHDARNPSCCLHGHC